MLFEDREWCHNLWQLWEGRQGALNSFGRSQSISQLLKIKDSLSLLLKGSDHQRNIYASTYNCSCSVSSFRGRQRCTRPTHLTAQCIKQKGRITVHYLKSVSQIYLLNHSISVQWIVSTWRLLTSKAANLRRDQFAFELRREHVIDARETRERFLCDWGSTREREPETFLSCRWLWLALILWSPDSRLVIVSIGCKCWTVLQLKEQAGLCLLNPSRTRTLQELVKRCFYNNLCAWFSTRERKDVLSIT